jgi:hypothetical protein
MKKRNIIAVLTLLSATIFTSFGQLVMITCTNSGSWGDTNIWDSNTVPGTNNYVDLEPGFIVTVDTNAIVQYFVNGESLAGQGGNVIMAANSTLEVINSGIDGTSTLGNLDASAPGNTVIYDNNPFYALHCNYYNLVFNSGTNTSPYDFFNGFVGPGNPAFAMTIAGNMTVIGKTKVQEGADFTINGNLLLDTNAQWDASSFNFTVVSNLTLGAGALLLDLDGANGSNYFGGNVLVSAAAFGWNVSDVITWGIGGSLTNNGLIVGTGYGSISFDGTGVIAGSTAIKIPTMTVNGTYAIDDTITLTTNTPTLNGTLVFDIARTNQIVLRYATSLTTTNTTATNYYSGNLVVINSGAAPTAGSSYKFFSASNYAGAFASTSFPALPAGLSWVDNTLTSGSIAVAGAIVGSPALTLSRNGNVLTLSWNSTAFPGYSVQGQTNSAGIHSNWSPTGSGTVSPYTVTIDPVNPPVFFRLSNP